MTIEPVVGPARLLDLKPSRTAGAPIAVDRRRGALPGFPTHRELVHSTMIVVSATPLSVARPWRHAHGARAPLTRS